MMQEKYEVPSIEVISLELEGMIAQSGNPLVLIGGDPIVNPIAD